MPLLVRPVTGPQDVKKFIFLPERIHRDHCGWVPPLYADERRLLDPQKNRAWTYCDCALALAAQGKRIVGRIMGIINHRYNELRREITARFSHLECYEDEHVAHALLDYVEQWAQCRGVNKIVGPMGFTDQDPEGFLVEGFDEEPALATCHNFEYMVRFLETKGYQKEVDYVVYKIPVPMQVPAFYEKIAARIRARGVCQLVEFPGRRALKRFVRPMLELMNETFRDLNGYSPLDRQEMDDLARRYLPIIDPHFVKAVVAGDQLVGFIIAISCLNEGLRKAKGRLLPLGWLHILRAEKRATRLDLLLGGIKEGYRGRGVDVLLGEAMIRSAREAGFDYMDSHHELESNLQVRAEMERMGGEVYKRYRIFQKAL